MNQPKRIYTNGGPVQVGGGVYIERKADHDLLRHCRDGDYVFILTSRQVGKSSLMNNVARQLKADDDTESVIVDLARMGAHLSAEQWYQGLLTRIERKFRLGINVADWWQAHQHLGDADRFTAFLQEELLAHVPNRIVIFVDEIDTTLSLNFSNDFFAAIRAMYHARDDAPEWNRLSFVLIGVATPHDLIDDARRTPFNIGEFVELHDFTFDDAWPLAEGFALPDAEARKVLGWALKWTGGHPFLTQQLCRAVAEQNNSHWTESELDALVEQTFFGAQAEQNIHLKAVRDMLTKRAPKGYEEAMLKTYRDVWRKRAVPDEARSIPKSHLKLAGVVQPNGNGALHLRNDIYREAFDDHWVKSNMPVNWTKRLQRIALTALVTVLLLNVPLGIYAWVQKGNVDQRADELKVALERERQARQEAQNQTRRAEKQAEIALANERRAEEQTLVAEKRRQEAESVKSYLEHVRKQEKQVEFSTWESLKSRGDIDLLVAFTYIYRNGYFTKLAREQIRKHVLGDGMSEDTGFWGATVQGIQPAEPIPVGLPNEERNFLIPLSLSPLKNAEVTLIFPKTGFTIKTLTDQEGNFDFGNLPPNTYRINIKCKGYRDKTINISISPAGGQRSFVELER